MARKGLRNQMADHSFEKPLLMRGAAYLIDSSKNTNVTEVLKNWFAAIILWQTAVTGFAISGILALSITSAFSANTLTEAVLVFAAGFLFGSVGMSFMALYMFLASGMIAAIAMTFSDEKPSFGKYASQSALLITASELWIYINTRPFFFIKGNSPNIELSRFYNIENHIYVFATHFVLFLVASHLMKKIWVKNRTS